MGVQLVVIEGRPLGGIIELRPGRLMIGRNPACQLRPKSPTVSQFHCSVTLTGDEVIVVDLGSSNGTLVNNQFLQAGEATKLVEGDRIQVGQLIFLFRTFEFPRDDGHVQEAWDAHLHSVSEDDPRGRTLLVPAKPELEGVPPPVERTEAITTFAYRELDQVTGAICIGLNWLQVGDEVRIRAMRKELVEIIARSHSRRVILDLEEVDALPSMAVATLVAMAMRCRVAGGGLRLHGLRPIVKRMMVALKIDELATLYSSRDAALNDPWE